MGLFSKILKPLEKPFRTGASSAARQAKKLGAETLAEQQAFLDEVRGGFAPTIERGQEAFQSLADFYAGDQGGIIGQAQSSPFYQALTSAGEQAVLRNQAMTGGFRSGTTQENLAQVDQNALMTLVNHILQGKAGIADTGMAQQTNFANIGSNLISGMGATRSGIADVDIAKAGQRQNLLSGILSSAAKAAAGA